MKLSIKAKLAIGIGLSLIISFLAMSYYNFWVSKKMLKERITQKEVRLAVQNINQKIQKDINRAVNLSSMMVKNTFVIDWLENRESDVDEIRGYLKNIHENQQVSSAFLVSDRTRAVYKESGFFKHLDPNDPNDNWYDLIKEKADLYVIDTGLNQLNNTVSVFVDYKILNDKGQMLGMAGVGLTLKNILELLDNFKIGQQGQIFFADENGLIRLHTTQEYIEKTNISDLPGTAPYVTAILSDFTHVQIHEESDEDMLIVSTYIPEFEWFLILEVSKEEILSAAYDSLINNLALGLLGSIFLILIITRVLSNSLLTPIVKLHQAVLKVKDKKFRTLVHVDSQDEIGELAESFNAMTRTINRHIIDQERRLTRDPLTQLPNRFMLTQEIERLESPALAIIDIDFFAQVNNLYGYETGDLVLRALRDFIFEQLPETDFWLFKLENDEFAVLTHNGVDSIPKLESLFFHLRAKLAQSPIRYQKLHILISCSMGIAAEKKENLITLARVTLRKAKQQKKAYLIYDDSLHILEEYRENIMWLTELREALLDKRIVNYYQPIFNHKTGKIEKYETLVRLIDSKGKVVSPAAFLDIAKQTMAYNEITRAVIQNAFATFRNCDHEFSINLSVQDIQNENTLQFLKEQIHRFPCPQNVVLELVESEGIQNYEQMRRFIQEMKSLDCKVAIDDFGTGYSNLEYVIRLDADYVKIDGSLVKTLPEDEDLQAIVQAIIDIAKRFSFKTIAEFVHSKEVFEVVKSLGIDYSQGYYIGKPEPKPTIPET